MSVLPLTNAYQIKQYNKFVKNAKKWQKRSIQNAELA